MNPQPFQDLYKLVRGSHVATTVVDCQSLAQEGDHRSALAQLRNARQSYSERYAKTLGRDRAKGGVAKGSQVTVNRDGENLNAQGESPVAIEAKKKRSPTPKKMLSREDRKKRDKEEKIRLAIDTFDRIISQLERLVERRKHSGAIKDKRLTSPQNADSFAESTDQSEAPKQRQISETTRRTPEQDQSESGKVNSTAAAIRSPLAPGQKETNHTAVREIAAIIFETLNHHYLKTGILETEQLQEFFELKPIQTKQDLQVGAIYFAQTPKASLLVKIESLEKGLFSTGAEVGLVGVLDHRSIKPLPLEAIMKLASQNQFWMLTSNKLAKLPSDQGSPESHGTEQIAVQAGPVGRENETDETKRLKILNGIAWEDGSSELQPSQHQHSQPSPKTDPRHESDSDDRQTESLDRLNVLDLGSFSQLLTSAQRSGLVPNADQIGYVRDKEFRLGIYDKAFQSIDMMHNRFLADAGQRQARLTREDVDIAAGRIKISPRELQAKRARDRMQTQEIDRAKRRFQVVLEGLRILMNHQ